MIAAGAALVEQFRPVSNLALIASFYLAAKLLSPWWAAQASALSGALLSAS